MKTKKILSIALGVAMIFASITPIAALAATQFVDMPNDWSTAALQNAVNNEIISGFDVDGKMYIRAKSPLTRAQMATIINNAFSSSATASLSGVTDVRSSDWFYDQMAVAVQMGSFAKASKMRPNDNITREEAFTVLAKVFKLPEKNNYVLLNNYNDAGNVSDYAKSRMEALLENGYISGSNNVLRPKANITRAEFATLMDNIVKQYINSSGTYSSVESGNILINTPNVTLKNVTVSGNLIIGDGVGEGNVSLDGVNVTGRLLIRGGGSNSIEITGNSTISELYADNPNNAVRIYASGNSKISNFYASGDVILDGTYSDVAVIGEDASINVNGTIQYMTVEASATVNIVKNAKLEQVNVESTASGTIIKGEGTVTKATVYANNTQVNTNSTKITVGSGVKNVSSGNSWISAGSTTTSDKDASNQKPPTDKDNEVTGVSLNITQAAFTDGDTNSATRIKLTVSITPSNASNEDVKWDITGSNANRFILYETATSTKTISLGDETDRLTVYLAPAKNITLSTSNKATVTVKTVENNKSASCDIVVKDPSTSTQPTASVTSVAKTSEKQKDVSFTLTNNPTLSGSWTVYTSASGSGKPSGISASNNKAVLTLSHATDVPAGTYYVAITESNKQESKRLALTVSPYGTTYTIKGTIVGEGAASGLPATLQLKNSSGQNVGSAVTAASNGVYTISGAGVIAGTGYTIAVSHEGYVTGTITSFNLSGNMTNVNLTLQKIRYSIEGFINSSVATDGLAATLQLKDINGNNIGSVVTANAKGIYKINDVLPGTYTITVTMNGYETGTINIVVNNSNLESQNCVLVLAATPKYTITIEINKAIDGPVGVPGDANIDDVTVKLTGNVVKEGITSGGNGCTFTDLPEGTYSIEASKPGFITETKSITVNKDDTVVVILTPNP